MKKILNFIYELGHLKKIKHEGWRMIGIDTPESVADHSLRAAQIGYLLAKLEKYPDPDKLSTILIFHDIGECRIGDLHKVASHYVKSNEKMAVQEQTANLSYIGQDILNKWLEIEEQHSPAGIIAKDADYLEQAVTAKEYLDIGYHKAQNWIDNVGKQLKTVSAKRIFREMDQTKPFNWWDNLKN